MPSGKPLMAGGSSRGGSVLRMEDRHLPQSNIVTDTSKVELEPKLFSTRGGLAPQNNLSVDDSEKMVPLAVFLIDKLVNSTVGSFTLDLKRPQVPRSRERTSLFTLAPYSPHPNSNSNAGYVSPGFLTTGGLRHHHRRRMHRPASAQPRYVDYDALPNVAFADSGARLKLMRHFKFGPKFTLTKYGHNFTLPQFDLGAGFSFEFDTADLAPSVRLKFRDVASIKLLPIPAIKVQRRVPLGTSGFGVRVSYECPLEHITQFYAPPARLLVALDNAVDTGIRITQSGLEFSANQWLLNGSARVRAAGVLHLPSELPIDENDMLLHFEVRRLGLKSQW